MNDIRSPLSMFHLTGERPGGDLDEIEQLGLRPALFAPYGDLPQLRYDYPVVLVADDTPYVRSLSALVDSLLQAIAPHGIDGERLRKHVLRLEREIRSLSAAGRAGTLLELWELAKTNLLGQADAAGGKDLEDSLSTARAALKCDGEVIGCDSETPSRLLRHVWAAVQEGKARRFRDAAETLAIKLSDILKADAVKSQDARGIEALRQSVGTSYEEAFDFGTMSDALRAALPGGAMQDKRRRRIRSALAVLEGQKFFAPAGGHDKDTWSFVFDRCTRALEAFHARLEGTVDLVKAMTIARLEIENRYNDKRHDPFFRRFDERLLGPDDLARLPSYLVCLRDGVDPREETAALLDILSSSLPIKVLVQNDDILENLSAAPGQLARSIDGSRLAIMALGLNNAYVLQASGAGLYGMREAIQSGLETAGPALFSVFSGLAGSASGRSRSATAPAPYLRAAAATESRAFPTFVHDPSAGRDWASRFSLGANLQVGADWSIHRIAYEDDKHQRVAEDLAFTFVDFVAADVRYATSFARVPRAEWHDGMVPVDAFLELDAGAAAEKVPYILMVDHNNGLHRVVVADPLIQAARRCRDGWRNLQELGGINNSHAKALLRREKEVWEKDKEQELAALRERPVVAAEALAPGSGEAKKAAPAADAKAPADSAGLDADAAVAQTAVAASDDPYIETPRCSTCEECVQINSRMFAYDANRQAYIADPDAGSYAELVQAAESCQVAIIHPGKPRNPDEPDLEALVERAQAFN